MLNPYQIYFIKFLKFQHLICGGNQHITLSSDLKLLWDLIPWGTPMNKDQFGSILQVSCHLQSFQVFHLCIHLLNQWPIYKLTLKQLDQDSLMDATNKMGKLISNMHKEHTHRVHQEVFCLLLIGYILFNLQLFLFFFLRMGQLICIRRRNETYQ